MRWWQGSGWRRLVAVACLLVGEAAHAEQSPFGWRGDGTGVFDVEGPSSLHGTERWRVALPTVAHGSPIVARDRVVVVCEPDLVQARALNDGHLIWERRIGLEETVPSRDRAQFRGDRAKADALRTKLDELTEAAARLDRKVRRGRDAPGEADRLAELMRKKLDMEAELSKSGTTRVPTVPVVGLLAATPVTDGRAVYVLWAERWIFSLELDTGKIRWAREIAGPRVNGHPGYHEGSSASPRLVGDQLVVPSTSLVWLASSDGHTLRDGGPYAGFGTPISFEDGRVFDHHGLRPGREDRTLLYSSPLPSAAGVLMAGSFAGPKSLRLLEYDGAGAVTADRELKLDRTHAFNFYASALILGNELWTVSEAGLVNVHARSSGARLFTTLLASDSSSTQALYASPAADRSHVYVVGAKGLLAIFERRSPWRELDRLAVANTSASPVLAPDGTLLLRTETSLIAWRGPP